MLPKVLKLINLVKGDSLYSNSIYLMLSTAVMAFFGFFFWIINARLFTPEQVGVGTTLISVMTLISSFSLLGMGNSLIKYLPTSVRKNKKISTSLTTIGILSVLVSIVYLIFLQTLSPKLIFVRENLFYSLMFVSFVVLTSLNTISESIFIAFRSSKYILVKNTIFSIVKLLLPFVLVALGAFGIFSALGIGVSVAFIISMIFLYLKFGYVYKPTVDLDIVKRMARFSLGNYAASFIGGLPAMVLPVLILNNLGAKFSAYFYMDMMIANLLYIIPSSVAQSLFAEGSYSESELKTNLIKATKLISLILIPGILVTVFFGKYILLAFGKEYSSEGIIFLRMLALSAIFIAINNIGNTIFFIKHRVKQVILINLIGAFLILSLSTVLSYQNLLGIGIAWTAGQCLISSTYLLLSRNIDRTYHETK